MHALGRVFLGDPIADELAIPHTGLKHLIHRVGPVLAGINGAIDRIPGTCRSDTDMGDGYRIKQDARLRARYSVRHDLVDAAPAGKPHPART